MSFHQFLRSEMKNTLGLMTLYDASGTGNDETVKKLLAEEGVDVNVATTAGVTPLFIASRQGHTEVVKLLLAEGADVNQATNLGNTPLIIASQEGHPEVVKLLLAKEGILVNRPNNDGVTPLSIASHLGHSEVVELLLATFMNPAKRLKIGALKIVKHALEIAKHALAIARRDGVAIGKKENVVTILHEFLQNIPWYCYLYTK